MIIRGVPPDDADEGNDALQHRGDLAGLEPGQLLAGLIQHGQEGQVRVRLFGVFLDAPCRHENIKKVFKTLDRTNAIYGFHLQKK